MTKKIITSLLTFILFIPYIGKASTIPPPPVYNPTLVFQTGNSTENTGKEEETLPLGAFIFFGIYLPGAAYAIYREMHRYDKHDRV